LSATLPLGRLPGGSAFRFQEPRSRVTKRRTLRTVRTPKKGEKASETPQSPHDRALTAFRETGTVSAACRRAKVGRSTWYEWIEKDPAFAATVRDAKEDVADDLEGEAVKRAKDSSDTLLIFLLKSLRPDKFREAQKLELVSPKVRERMHRTIQVIRSTLPPDQGEQLLKQLDDVWR